MKLKKPKNYRFVYTKCCANCRHVIYVKGDLSGFAKPICDRDPDEYEVVLDDAEYYHHVCDYFEK